MPGWIKRHAPALLTAIFVMAAYLPIFWWMTDRWLADQSYYTHGPLIPLISGFLLWNQRRDLARETARESCWGLPLIVFGLMGHLVGALLRVYFLVGFSLIAVLIGVTLHFYGTKIFRRLAFAHLFLIFMVPLPRVVITKLSFHMKMLAAELSAGLLNGMQVDALREGSVIRLAKTVVVVDDVCSGLRSLVSLMALGAVMAYWMRASSAWRRVLLFLSVAPIALMTNIGRVVALSLMAETWGAAYATGWIHDLTGVLVFVVAFFMLYCLSKGLE